MATFAKVRRMYFRDQLSISEIARRTSLTRNTIKKWLRAPAGVEPAYRRSHSPSKIKPFEAQLLQALQTDTHRPKRDRRTALALFQSIKKDGYSGSYPRVTQFVREWRDSALRVSAKSAFVPLHFALGEAFQFDWSEEGLIIAGIYRRIQVAHLKLCASRAFLVIAYPAQSHEMLFDAHTRAFAALGGIPLRGIYDNMKTAVDKVLTGKARVVNARFFAMTAHYLFDPDFCNVAAGWEKGVVEKNVQDSRRRIWQEAQSQPFDSFTALNAWLVVRCRALWTELAHPDYPTLTVAEVLEDEQCHLMPMPSPFDGYIELVARVSSTCLITVQRNRYSVPCQYANQKVSVRLYPEHIDVYADQLLLAIHLRGFDRDHTYYDWQHYIPLAERKPGVLRNGAPFAEMPAPLRQLRQALLRRDGGDRVMAKVLACIPPHGLDAVLVAVELVLESGAPSAEHVLNVLARLRAPSAPTPLDTPLQVTEPPLANTQRYDQLHRVEAISHE